MAGLAPPLARRRATVQLLRRPPSLSPTAIVRALLAVQAQDFQSARLALRACGERLEGQATAHLLMLAALHGIAREPVIGRVAPRLLPAFDPYLVGWRDRTFAVPPAHARLVHPGGGVLRAVATTDGRAVGTWSTRRHGDRLTVEIESFGPLAADVAAALRDAVADVARFEDRLPSDD